FAFDAAYTRGATTLVHLGNSFLVGKNLVVIPYRTDVRVPFVLAPYPRRVCDHGFQGLFDDFRVLGKSDRIAIALAHLAAVGSRKLRNLGQQSLRLWEYWLEHVIKAPGNLTREFDMGNLILSNRHGFGLINENVRRLK